ncbi:MAG: ATP-dependent Clp protease ATP-binding subunit [Clostridia bacterium]
MSMNFDDIAKIAVAKAEEYAYKSGGIVGTEHLLCGIIFAEDSSASKLLKANGITVNDIPKIIRLSGNSAQIELSTRVEKILLQANEYAETHNTQISCELMLFAILQQTNSYAVNALVNLGFTNIDGLIAKIKQMLLSNNFVDDNQFGEQNSGFPKGFKISFSANNAFNPNDNGFNSGDFNGNEQNENNEGNDDGGNIYKLEKLGVDLTEKARQKKLDPVIGRSKEIDRIIQILSRRTKNNPVLIGEPGVGKSAVVEGLAQAIVEGNVPEMLKNKKIFSLDMASVVAGTKYRGEFEQRLQSAIKQIQADGNIIVFIDEIHNIVGAGSAEGSMDAGNILKPMLARGELQTIGATTINEYRKHIEKDAALERRFQPIIVEPPTVEETITILNGLRNKYEAHHKVSITQGAIKAAAELSDRYISDRFLPDKAIDLIDEACSKKRISNFVSPDDVKEIEAKITAKTINLNNAVSKKDYETASIIQKELKSLEATLKERKDAWKNSKKDVLLEVDENDIAEILSSSTSIPVSKLTQSESEKLLNLENELHKRVIGQDEAINAVSKAVRRARAGLQDPKRPIGSFIFLGPTGVGKTELCKALAEYMFGDENLMIRFDMSEYMEKINVSKLIGSAPGYVGYEEGGQLTEKVRRKPYSVILFDEIEKAHPDVFNLLLQIMEDGRLTDSQGRTVNFKNTIVIMTSNIGASDINAMPKLGFSNNTELEEEKSKEKHLNALKQTMKPEFINRIDDIIIFHKLEKEDIKKIADIIINQLILRLKKQDITLTVDESVKEYIVEKGFDVEYGARPLRRAVQKYIEDALSDQILAGKIQIKDNILCIMQENEVVFKKS